MSKILNILKSGVLLKFRLLNYLLLNSQFRHSTYLVRTKTLMCFRTTTRAPLCANIRSRIACTLTPNKPLCTHNTTHLVCMMTQRNTLANDMPNFVGILVLQPDVTSNLFMDFLLGHFSEKQGHHMMIKLIKLS